MLILHPEARLEDQAVVEWYEARNPPVAAALDQQILDALEAVAHMRRPPGYWLARVPRR